MKYKNIILIAIILLATGCNTKYNYEINTVHYNIDIDKTFNEEVILTYPKDIYNKVKEEEQNEELTGESLEYSLLNEKIEPIYSYHDTFYNKKISKNDDKVSIDLKYNYLEDEYIYSQNIVQCFEVYNIESEEDYFKINLSGNFECYNDMPYYIKVTTKHTVLETNGTKKDNSYNWVIDENNHENTNIVFKIERDYDEMSTTKPNTQENIIEIIKDIIKVLLMILLIGLIVFLRKKEIEM